MKRPPLPRLRRRDTAREATTVEANPPMPEEKVRRLRQGSTCTETATRREAVTRGGLVRAHHRPPGNGAAAETATTWIAPVEPPRDGRGRAPRERAAAAAATPTTTRRPSRLAAGATGNTRRRHCTGLRRLPEVPAHPVTTTWKTARSTTIAKITIRTGAGRRRATGTGAAALTTRLQRRRSGDRDRRHGQSGCRSTAACSSNSCSSGCTALDLTTEQHTMVPWGRIRRRTC